VTTLLRLTELAGGRILIDGIDISEIGLHDLRSAVAIIPQDPVLFEGTVRYNVDPFGEHNDDKIWEALDKAHLKEKVIVITLALTYYFIRFCTEFVVCYYC
jgi:ABC-type multidrug transport system fused ATPase/permease subunit